jgi:hypothetical protein
MNIPAMAREPRSPVVVNIDGLDRARRGGAILAVLATGPRAGSAGRGVCPVCDGSTRWHAHKIDGRPLQIVGFCTSTPNCWAFTI